MSVRAKPPRPGEGAAGPAPAGAGAAHAGRGRRAAAGDGAARGEARLWVIAVSETGPPALTHLDARGAARMVDVGGKEATRRVAVARARVRMSPATLAAILGGGVPKGDVLAVARVAGIMAAKQTSALIPLCHPVPVTAVAVDLQPVQRGDDAWVEVEARVETVDRTGVEMEALVAAAVAALTVYDMCKALERGMVIEGLQLWEKRGGRSGDWIRPAAPSGDGEEPQ